jgi:hypothetical protein
MKTIPELKNWKFKQGNLPTGETKMSVRIHVEYPRDIVFPTQKVLAMTPAQRSKRINDYVTKHINPVIKKFKLIKYKWVKPENHLHGIIIRTTLDEFKQLKKIKAVSLQILKISGAVKIATKYDRSGFYCVKVIVAIQVEKAKEGMQSWDERYILIKADSFDDAYNKVEKNAKSYESEPYINPYGELVRWKYERMVDCFEASIYDIKELNNKEGVEVYSRLRLRKMTKERYWNGKIK